MMTSWEGEYSDAYFALTGRRVWEEPWPMADEGFLEALVEHPGIGLVGTRDGDDVLLASRRGSVPLNPIETVEMMAAICVEAEQSEYNKLDADFLNVTFTRIDQSIAYGALFTAHHLRVKAIVALTESGSTALWMSRHNIDTPIFALTPSVTTQRKASLYRNVRAHYLLQQGTSREVLKQAEDLLVEHGIAKKGDMIVVTWGEPMGQVGGTNALKIVKVGEFS